MTAANCVLSTVHIVAKVGKVLRLNLLHSLLVEVLNMFVNGRFLLLVISRSVVVLVAPVAEIARHYKDCPLIQEEAEKGLGVITVLFLGQIADNEWYNFESVSSARITEHLLDEG